MHSIVRPIPVLGSLLILAWSSTALAQEPLGVHLPQPGGPFVLQPPQVGATTLNQPLHPNPSFCYAAAQGIGQSIADNFLVLTQPFEITQVMIWGIFFLDDTPGTDSYTILVHSDSGGLPGPVVEQQTGVPAARVDTGLIFADKTIYEFTMTLGASIVLSPGTYWFELFNDASSQSDDFCWIQGLADGTNGLPDSAFAFETPGVNWMPTGGDLALILSGAVVPVELQSFSVE